MCVLVCLTAWPSGPKTHASSHLLENNLSPGNYGLSTSICILLYATTNNLFLQWITCWMV